MAKVNRVFVIAKVDFETQSIVYNFISRDLFYLVNCLEIADIVASSKPAVASDLHVLFRVDEWLHALTVGRVGFEEVNDIKCVFNVLSCI